MKANLLAIGTLMALSAGSLLAVGPCISSTGLGTGAPYIGAGSGCNVVITFNANGSISTTIPNAFPYDGVEDTLVGVNNLTAAPIFSFTLTGTGGTPQLFGFDGDGACATSNLYVAAASCVGHDSTGYGGPGVTFSAINGALTSGTVNFAGGIAATTGTAWFSLEEPPSLNLQVNNVPEPASIALLGSVVMFVSFRLRRRKAKV
jgi:hypothetical protein